MLCDVLQRVGASLQPVTLERWNGLQDKSSRRLIFPLTQSCHRGCTLFCYPTFAMSPKAMPIPKNTVRKKKTKISAALQSIGSISYEAAPLCTRHKEATTTSPPTAIQVKTRANTSYEAITRATTPKRKKVTGALLQGIACASNEATPQCMKHEAEAKRLRQQFWQSIVPRWKKLQQDARQAGKQPPDHVKWCEERARWQCVPNIWKDWS